MGESYLDLKGLKCPLPVLKARKALRSLAPGQFLRAETTDPLAEIDIPNFCRENGHRLVSVSAGGDTMVFLIEKGDS